MIEARISGKALKVKLFEVRVKLQNKFHPGTTSNRHSIPSFNLWKHEITDLQPE